ncbi:MAG: NAD-dependent epimerase/dehydratase family protein [Candidatus Peribacteraceae bacterium]|nr:NAD-dependent epimerase/dehydratase family protein [Candidatus Peribacteraceae bacterium]
MSRPTLLVTGSAGLIGSEAVKYFAAKDYDILGVDNNMRQYFFGPEASTAWNREQLEKAHKNYTHFTIDIRDKDELEKLFTSHKIDLIIHTAAQPSHDWAAKEPLTDFTVNALATLNLLELTRLHAPEAVFIFTSTNKVYGDRPNFLPLIEQETRWELPETHQYYKGIDESMSIDQCLHSVFGASKVAADVMVQEYGKYFGLKTGVFRGGCLTGPSHSGAKLHGFLAYLMKCVANGIPYTMIGYKGKQVRDNIHSADVLSAFAAFAENPHPGEVYNIGGTRFSNISILEAMAKAEKLLGKKAVTNYDSTPRMGDHQWYISDMSKFQSHYSQWKQQFNNDHILEEIASHGHLHA